jgi:hypothetical protein
VVTWAGPDPAAPFGKYLSAQTPLSVGLFGPTIAVVLDTGQLTHESRVMATKQAIRDVRAGTNVTVTQDAQGYVVSSTGGAGASATTTEKDLGSTPTWRGKFTITDATISGTSKVLCWQAPGPYTGKGTRADEAEMQPVSVIAVEPASGSAVVKWETPPMIAESPLATISSPLGNGAPSASSDRQTRATRLGKVRGNVKFSYVVFS